VIRTAPGGLTKVAGVIGDPVTHSLSPLLHNAAYAALGLDWVYVALPVAPGAVAAAIAGAHALGLRGLSVTMPHKEAAAAACSRVRAPVARLGAANTVVFGAEGSVADSTDGAGLIDDLADAGFDGAGKRCVVLGAGGAARAAVLALAEAGAASVGVVNRTPARAEQAAQLAGAVGRVADIEACREADLVVNATPLGMPGVASPDGTAEQDSAPGLASAGLLLAAGQLAYDMVYVPARTAFLIDAEEHGAAIRGGLGMLVHQAARQFRLFTGVDAPIEAMWAAARPVAVDRPPVA
jgi:shikimate dehydrogenase